MLPYITTIVLILFLWKHMDVFLDLVISNQTLLSAPTSNSFPEMCFFFCLVFVFFCFPLEVSESLLLIMGGFNLGGKFIGLGWECHIVPKAQHCLVHWLRCFEYEFRPAYNTHEFIWINKFVLRVHFGNMEAKVIANH